MTFYPILVKGVPFITSPPTEVPHCFH